MDLGIKGKKALVTGAGRGLGESIAQCLAREGAKVAVVARTEVDIENVLRKMGGRAQGHWGQAADLMPDGAPSRMIEILNREFGSPDIIVNNAGGTLDITDPFCSLEDWRKLWRFNLEIAIEINRLVIPKMQERRWGRVVHVSSIASLENQGPVPYCSLKAAMTAYARSMGRLVSKDGVIVTSVLPGAVFTEKGFWDQKKQTKPEEFEKYLKERMAIGRFGEPDEIGNVVSFLCSQHASFMVGSTVPVDGGQAKTFFQW